MALVRPSRRNRPDRHANWGSPPAACHVAYPSGSRLVLDLGRRAGTESSRWGGLLARSGRETRGRSLLGVPSPWLLPGQRPGSALTEDALAQRLHAIGISPRQGRSTVLLTLAAEVPAAILAKTLGIHVQVAVQWQKISAGDWTSYAADVSCRSGSQPVPSRHEIPGQA